MKKNRIISVLSGAALLLSAACTNETLTPGGGTNEPQEDPAEGVYLAVNFDLPSAKETRSYTDGENSSSGGTEVGTDAENKVNRVAIVLATYTNQFIAFGVTEKISPVGSSGRSYRTSSKFSKTDLSDYYSQDEEMFAIDAQTGAHKINVFVFCNPTEDLINRLGSLSFDDSDITNEDGDGGREKKPWFDIIGKWDEATTSSADMIWRADNFLMSNASIATRLFPPTLEEWEPFSTEGSPFNLSGINNFGRPNEIDNLTDRGNVLVERTAARYDFRDGALDGVKKPDDPNYNGFKAQTYHVVLNADETPIVDVFLGKMSLVNMNKNYYYLRRVSNNGRPIAYKTNGEDNNLTLCGPELPWYSNDHGGDIVVDDKEVKGNYVVDAEAKWKYIGTYGNKAPSSGFTNYLNYPFFDENGVLDNVDTSNDRWYTSQVKDVLGGKVNDNSGNYKVWRYLTEGTIPGVNSQKNSVSNGIVFKGQMKPGRKIDEEKDDFYTKRLLKALEVVETQTDEQVASNHLIFKYGGHLYCGWDHIKRMAIYLAMTDLKKVDGKWKITLNRSVGLYNAVFGVANSGNTGSDGDAESTEGSETSGLAGGFGSIKISIEGDDPSTANFFTEDGNVTIEDDLAINPDSPDAYFGKWDHEGGYVVKPYEDFRDAVVRNKITIYQESYDKELGGWAYYCYYYYWNRHNDNGMNGVMGPMEFAVVRNNVYKLAVTKISQLGHPRIIENDPDAPDPNTDDEEADLYITVTCTTLPWVVRTNNIVL